MALAPPSETREADSTHNRRIDRVFAGTTGATAGATPMRGDLIDPVIAQLRNAMIMFTLPDMRSASKDAAYAPYIQPWIMSLFNMRRHL